MMQLKSHIQADSNSEQGTICRPVQAKGWVVLHLTSFGQVQLRLGMNAFCQLALCPGKTLQTTLPLPLSSVQLSSAPDHYGTCSQWAWQTHQYPTALWLM
jgi:hypothetical protein